MSDERGDYVSKSNLEFFEKVLKGHDCVSSFEAVSEREYTLERDRGDTWHVYLTGKYTFGILDFYELTAAMPHINCIVTASPYLSYTRDAKEAAMAASIGLFKVRWTPLSRPKTCRP